jgi:hypothetical protein
MSRPASNVDITSASPAPDPAARLEAEERPAVEFRDVPKGYRRSPEVAHPGHW